MEKFLIWASKRSRDGTVELFVAHFQMPHGA